jgi:hypothetical protein
MAWKLAVALLLPVGLACTQEPANLRDELGRAVAAWLEADDAGAAAALPAVLKLARGKEALLAAIVRSKGFLRPTGDVAQGGTIDEQYRFVAGPAAHGQDDNQALLAGPATGTGLFPLVVYVPDSTRTAGFERALAEEGTRAGRYVFLVPDEKRDNRYEPSVHEHRRHTGPLRGLLLSLPIDPDRVYMIGSGRGGHATWDVGLTAADRWAGIFPCNGGLVHEGGWKGGGGVFVDNARSFAVFTVYNTTFDHGIESSRYAVRKFREWGFQVEAQEEPQMRVMGITEAMAKLAPVVRDAHPRRIQKRFNHLEDGEHYWLRALDRTPHEWDPSARITVHGDWPKDRDRQLEVVWDAVRKQCGWLAGRIADNRVEVTVQGISRVRVYFDPELLDYGAPVTLVLNGKVRRTLTPVRQVEVMLQHVRETGDTSRLYWASVDLAVAG